MQQFDDDFSWEDAMEAKVRAVKLLTFAEACRGGRAAERQSGRAAEQKRSRGAERKTARKKAARPSAT